MHSWKDIKMDPNKMKVAKWFGSIIFIVLMYGLFSDFGLLAALVLIYLFIV